MSIKDRFKPMFPLFLNLLRKFPNAHGRFYPHPVPNVISPVKPVLKATNGSERKKHGDVTRNSVFQYHVP